MSCYLLILTTSAFHSTTSQVSEQNTLGFLASTEVNGIMHTRNNLLVSQTSDGGYISFQQRTISATNTNSLSAQLSILDVPEEVKQEIEKKYISFRSYNSFENFDVSVFMPDRKVFAQGKSIIDDLPIETHLGRQFKVYKIYYNNRPINTTIFDKNFVIPMLKNTTSISLATFGLVPELAESVTKTSGVFGAGMTLFDVCQAALDGEITGSTENCHLLAGHYSSIENVIYAQTLWQNGVKS